MCILCTSLEHVYLQKLDEKKVDEKKEANLANNNIDKQEEEKKIEKNLFTEANEDQIKVMDHMCRVKKICQDWSYICVEILTSCKKICES